MRRETQVAVHAVDDNPLHRHVLESICIDASHVIFTCSNALDGMCSLREGPDVILINLDHAAVCPRYLVGMLLSQYADIPIIGYSIATSRKSMALQSMSFDRLRVMTYGELIVDLRDLISSPLAVPDLEPVKMVSSANESGDLAGFMHLSPREKEVYCLVGKGFGAGEISDCVGCGVRTVETHLRKIRERLKIPNVVDMRRRSFRITQQGHCYVFSHQEDHLCPYTGSTVGKCPYLV